MTTLAHHTDARALIKPPPVPRCGAINVRPAVAGDLAFIDALQKMHSHMVGWMPMKSLEGHLEKGRILIAEQTERDEETQRRRDGAGGAHEAESLRLSVSPSLRLSPTPVGYVLSADQYMKRDDVGIIYQLNVLPLKQRGLIGASLIKAVFERAAYGCKLFCCWCAQDIQANWFWESIGFVPLAFRTGSRAKQRIHIFWQRRVRDNDDSTPYWFPSQTTGGAVGEDRIVLPIPVGTHCRDAKPLVLPGLPAAPSPLTPLPEGEAKKLLPGGALVKPRPEQVKVSKAERAVIMRSQSKHLGGVPLGKKAVLRGGRIQYVEREDFVAELDTPEELAGLDPESKKKKVSRGPRQPRAKNDPKYVAAARELRDRYLEQINTERMLPAANGKYDVSRQLAAGAPPAPAPVVALLDAA